MDTSMSDASSQACMSNDDCPGNQICNTQTNSNQCEEGDSFQFVRLQDVTREMGSTDQCEGGSPGADLFGTRLEDGNGDGLGWAQTIVTNFQGRANRYTRASAVINGSEPALEPFGDSGQTCPKAERGTKFRTETVVSLGCGGSIVVGFSNGNDDFRPLRTGQRLRVYEYGDQCFQGSNAGDSEFVEVQPCDGSADDFRAGDTSGCAEAIGSGSGEFVVTLR